MIYFWLWKYMSVWTFKNNEKKATRESQKFVMVYIPYIYLANNYMLELASYMKSKKKHPRMYLVIHTYFLPDHPNFKVLVGACNLLDDWSRYRKGAIPLIIAYCMLGGFVDAVLWIQEAVQCLFWHLSISILKSLRLFSTKNLSIN